MKNLATILVFVFAFTFTTQAQKNKKRDQRRPKLSVEQHTDLAVKKMTLALDLSEKQQNKIKPLIAAKMAERKAFMEKRKEARKERKRPTADEIYAVKSKMLDNQIAMRNNMKEILNKEQFEKFEKMQKLRKMQGKKMMMKKMQNKRGKKVRRK
ncbi:hypothetical protein [Polaribacter sp.]|uniref:hypothetical protein n=1 Tax=Polaribacter sp. TaxID=1920175 RepID=UPI003F6C862B